MTAAAVDDDDGDFSSGLATTVVEVDDRPTGLCTTCVGSDEVEAPVVTTADAIAAASSSSTSTSSSSSSSISSSSSSAPGWRSRRLRRPPDGV